MKSKEKICYITGKISTKTIPIGRYNISTEIYEKVEEVCNEYIQIKYKKFMLLPKL